MIGIVRIGMATAFTVLAACQPEHYSWFQETEITVQTPEGLRTASSVVRVHLKYYPDGNFAASSALDGAVVGEAVALNLGSRGILLVPLPLDDLAAYGAYYEKGLDLSSVFAKMAQGQMPQVVVSEDRLPYFYVMPNDPFRPTIAHVRFDKLNEALGADVKFISLKVKIVEGPITEGRLLASVPDLAASNISQCSNVPCAAEDYQKTWPYLFQSVKK